MPYGFRVFCVILGGLLFVFGLVSAVGAIRDGGDTAGFAAASGLGVGLLATAFVRRD